MNTHGNAIAFDAFISYSRSAEMARRVFASLSRVGRSPWQLGRWWGLKVFLDREQIRVGDELPRAISDAVRHSKYFVLLASKAAARSKWVAKELEFWLSSRPASDVLIVVLDGAIEWDEQQNDFNWQVTDCIPAILKGRYRSEPLWADWRQMSSAPMTRCSKREMQEAIALIGAKILGVTPEVLISQERRDLSRFRKAVGLVFVSLIVCAALAGYFWMTAETPADKEFNLGRAKIESRRDWDDINIALTYFERALKSNPKHVRAWLAKADAHILLIGYGGPKKSVEELEMAQEAFNRAKEFGGDNTPEYYYVQGRLRLYKDKDVRGACESLSKAVEMDPRNVNAWRTLADTYTFLRQHDEAIRISQHAFSIVREEGYGEDDNRYTLSLVFLAWTYFYAGKYEAALDVIQKILKKRTNPQANRFLGHIYTVYGESYSNAVESYLQAQPDKIREPNLWANYICARKLAGQLTLAQANKKLEKLQRRAGNVSLYRLAEAYACMGETDKALELLKQARDEGDIFVLWSAVDPLLSSLREKAEFQVYLASVGLKVAPPETTPLDVRVQHGRSWKATMLVMAGLIVSIVVIVYLTRR